MASLTVMMPYRLAFSGVRDTLLRRDMTLMTSHPQAVSLSKSIIS